MLDAQLWPAEIDLAGIDDPFGYWLSGFIDGEGCFTIHEHRKKGHGPSYMVRFTLCVRDDDAAILDEIAERTGIGRVYRVGASGTSRPQATWHVETKNAAAALVRILDRYPLRAKKARDYATWREAVQVWSAARRTGNDWTELRALRELLISERQYVSNLGEAA